ncbi:MAG: hypothetical protein Q9163_000694 [Psora crenata]
MPQYMKLAVRGTTNYSGVSDIPITDLVNYADVYVGTSSNKDARGLPFHLSNTTLQNDLSKECPQWVLSAYAPGKDAPVQLFGGHLRELSFEELRMRHYELAAQGNEQQAIREAQALVSNAESQIQNALNDIDGAIQYILKGETQHPNRIDICNAKGAVTGELQSTNAFQKTVTPFGQASNSSASFGGPSIPSTMGPTSTPTFGQRSALTSTFGRPSAPGFAQPAVDQTSSLGGSTAGSGQPPSTFGQPSAPFGGPQQKPLAGSKASNPFQRSSTIQEENLFRQSSAPSLPSSLGQPSVPAQNPSFGQLPGTGNTNPFARTPPAQAAGGVYQNRTAPPHSTISAQPPPSAAISSPLVPPGSFQQKAEPGLAVAASSVMPRPSPGAQASVAQVQKDIHGKLRSWNKKTVSYIDDEPCYRNTDGSWQRIWFPDGAPAFVNSVGLPDEAYDDAMRENYMHLKEKGAFKDGIMPLLAPKREWCNWNL